MTIYIFAFDSSFSLQDILKHYVNEAKNETSSANATRKSQKKKGLVELVFLNCASGN